MSDRSLDPNIPLQAFAVLGEYQADLERILKVIHLDHVKTYRRLVVEVGARGLHLRLRGEHLDERLESRPERARALETRIASVTMWSSTLFSPCSTASLRA